MNNQSSPLDTLLQVKVIARTWLADDISGFDLSPLSDGDLPAFEAGAHIDLHVPGGPVRQYSLYDLPGESPRYRIGVLRDPQSRGGSVKLLDNVQAGDTLTISAPRNHFALHDDQKDRSILFAGGIGITPIFCMAQQLAREHRPFEMHYCGRTLSRMALIERLQQAQFDEESQVHMHVDDGAPDQQLDARSAIGAPSSDKHLYVCGPTGFMDHILQTARELGWDEAHLHREYFAAAPIDSSGDERFEIEIGSSGQVIDADKVLLATGNPPPAELPLAQVRFEHAGYIRNPWLDWDSRLPDRSENVILIGTGLTTLDVFLTLLAQGWQGKIFAISRNGLLPLSHFKGIEYPEFPPEDPTSLSLTDLVTLLQTHCARLRQQGANPAIVVDKLRPFTQRIWQHLSVAEKQHFLRTWKTPWNVTRHRVAQSIHAQVMEAQARGQFEVVQGSIRQLSASGDRIDVLIANRTGVDQNLQGALVINCTGPQESFAGTAAPLFQNLFARGLAQPDDLDLGIQVGTDFAVIDQAGQRSDWLFAMGPLLKGTLWETTAVPELRIQAQRVAETIHAALERRPAAVAGSFQEMHADVLEYYI